MVCRSGSIGQVYIDKSTYAYVKKFVDRIASINRSGDRHFIFKKSGSLAMVQCIVGGVKKKKWDAAEVR
jgi:hypothetical protein